MLQHNTLEKHIKELGQLCLNITKIINKKKESSHKLTHETGFPEVLILTVNSPHHPHTKMIP